MSAGFSSATVAAIRLRDGGRCVGCGRSDELTTQHRMARGMGGVGKGDLARVLSSHANGLTLCGSGTTGCHGWAERNRVAARRLGWSLKRVHEAGIAKFILEHTHMFALIAGRAGWWFLEGDRAVPVPDVANLVLPGVGDLSDEDHPALALLKAGAIL